MHLRLLLCLLLFSATRAAAQVPDSVRVLIDSALNVMEHRSFYGAQIDWPALRSATWQRAATARTYGEAFPALAWAFDQLGDKHGWVTINDSTHNNNGIQGPKPVLSAGLKQALSKGPRLYNATIAGRYAYVNIHFFMGQTEEAMNAYAQRIQDSLCRHVGPDTKGIIIDLRLNGGGNSFPMYQGVANVLGDRMLTEAVDGRGRTTGRFGIRDGRVTMHGNYGDSLVLRLQRSCGDLSGLPVVVLLSPVSGSSAEQLAIAFSSRPRTVLLGERSAGYVTANNGFLLPGKDNGIVLAESITRNMKGKLFTDYVEPDIVVAGGDNYDDLQKDAKIRAAVKWLRAQQKKGPRG